MSANIDKRRPEHVAQYLNEAAGEPVNAEEAREPTNTGAIAEALGVDRDQLLRYARNHPNPTAAYIVGWAGADPDLAEEVDAWLDAYGRTAAERWEVGE